jgi:hypothetical protein
MPCGGRFGLVGGMIQLPRGPQGTRTGPYTWFFPTLWE